MKAWTVGRGGGGNGNMSVPCLWPFGQVGQVIFAWLHLIRTLGLHRNEILGKAF